MGTKPAKQTTEDQMKGTVPAGDVATGETAPEAAAAPGPDASPALTLTQREAQAAQNAAAPAPAVDVPAHIAATAEQIREKKAALRTAKPADRIGLAREIGTLQARQHRQLMESK